MQQHQLPLLRKTALSLAILMLYQSFFPTISWALTSGPTPPEVQSFEAVGSTQMVDLFSGDFTYNIPLIEIPGANGGYPINLFYNSVTNAEEEATMVGLGWNLGIGALTNQVRGLPDAFNGDRIRRKLNLKDNWTIGVSTGLNFEFWGGDEDEGTGDGSEQTQNSSSNAQTANIFQPSLSLGIKLMYNNYKGFGYSIDPNLSLRMGKKKSSGKSLALDANFGFSLNSLEGASFNAGLDLATVEGQDATEAETGLIGGGMGISMSGREGLRSLSVGVAFRRDVSKQRQNKKRYKGYVGAQGGFRYSFANSSYTPRIDMPFGGTNVSINAKLGTDVAGIFASGTVGGFYSEQWLKDQNKWVDAPAYGFLHSEKFNYDNGYQRERALLDFNREKDGIIYHEQPNLAVPIATPDILSVSGHGVGGSYRPYRSDLGGVFSDPEVKSNNAGGAFGIDFGSSGIFTHFGANLNVNFSKNESIRPFDAIDGYGFQAKVLGDDYEPYYYASVGEMTADTRGENIKNAMGGDAPLRVNRDGLNFGDHYEFGSGTELQGTQSRRNDGERKTRNSSIQPITNGELVSENGLILLPEYRVDYFDFTNQNNQPIVDYDQPNTLLALQRDADKASHLAGYTVVNDGGARWNYALPVQNHVQYQATFAVDQTSNNNACRGTISIPKPYRSNVRSYTIDDIEHEVSGTSNFLDLRETPGYAHSHLLTSILGADYVDLTQDGPSDDDLGYWMKVTYAKTSNEYIWKSPFYGANFLEGHKMIESDDKATFMAGKREQFYPGRLETNTHLAEFYYSPRKDAAGASNILQNRTNSEGSDPEGYKDRSAKLDSIRLYSKIELDQSSNPRPIKTVHFDYTYELCGNVQNNWGQLDESGTHQGINQNKGKLTLRSLWFTYERSTRGELSPYRFEYNGSNENYGEYHFDRWGTYRDLDANDPCTNINRPYTEQFDPAEVDGDPLDGSHTYSTKDQLKAEAATWHLSDIFLPSGSQIHLEIERDEYAYVQDRSATQMFQINRVGGTNSDNKLSNGKVDGDNPNEERRKIFFPLERPINSNSSAAEIQGQLDPYFEDLYQTPNGYKQLFYKLNANLLESDGPQDEPYHEDVTGYVEIESYGVDATCTGSQGHYTEAYIMLRPFPVKIRKKRYHPMVVNNWQYLKLNLSDQMYGYSLGNAGGTSIGARLGQFLGMIGELIATFRNYYKVCRDRNYGIVFNPDKSFIRLNSPDLRKYGDGIRVKQVTMQDSYWSAFEDTPTYGTVYDYDMEEERYDPIEERLVKTGRMISSGVATNEPAVGTEENALRYAKDYINDVKNRTDNLFTFEYPVNESYYPGPGVGYRRVTVKSLASEYALRMAQGEGAVPSEIQALGGGFATSGATVNEFYTAADFPIVTQETVISDKRNPAPRWIPIPFIGDIRIDKYTATQGYQIELNDMHGRPKSVSSYAQDEAGHLVAEPISSATYHYQEQPQEVYTLGGKSRLRHRLDNEVTVLLSDRIAPGVPNCTGCTDRTTAELGVEREFFTDARESVSKANNGGLDFNSELFILLFPALFPVPWPSIGHSTTRVKTAVTNKVVRRSGILKKVVATDGQSTVETENIAFDRFTGQPLLTSVNNNFDDKVYQYNIPGHFAYESMGSAAANYGLEFEATVNISSGPTSYAIINEAGFANAAVIDKLVRGDEFLVYLQGAERPYTRGTYVWKNTPSGNSELYFNCDAPMISGTTYRFQLLRSGNRNHLALNVGGITSLDQDPTKNRSSQTCLNCGVGNFAPGFSASEIRIYTPIVQDVLQVNATTFSDSWFTEVDKACGTYSNYTHYTDDPNPYRSGQLGIWRPHRSYAYVRDREQSTDVNLETDGTFTLEAFDWSNPFIEECTDWRLVEETTKYGPNGEGLETKNILGIYNSALYGYGDYLPTAVGANARHYEIAFEGFEEVNLPGAVNIDLHQFDQPESGHFDFLNVCDETDRIREGAVGRIVGTYNSDGTEITVDYPYNGELPSLVWMRLFDPNGKQYLVQRQATSAQSNTEGQTVITFTGSALGDDLPDGLCLGGDAILSYKYATNRNASYNNGFLLKGFGHTGDQCMFLSGDATWEMSSLRLSDQKEYVFSCWINVGLHPATHTYENSGYAINIDGTEIYPSGPIIDGWQRIEGTFTPSPGFFNTIQFDVGLYPAYYDDFRIFPADGNLQTYVYDKANYRLTEILDDNNFFTRYIYDSEGNLISTQRETIDGVKTLQESRNFVRNEE